MRTSEAMGGLVRVILVYKSGLAFFLHAKTKKLAIYNGTIDYYTKEPELRH